MKHVALTLRSAIKLMAIVFVLSHSCFAQDRSKQETGQQRRTVRQLHPEAVEEDPPKGIRLLVGYKHKGAIDFEGNQVGEISKNDGVKINYEMGFSQGMAVESDRKAVYVWYREQRIDARVTRYALSKRNILIISIPLSEDPTSLHVANFYGTIKKT
jgi:hypothetical protein